MKTGIELIQDERARQIFRKGHTHGHDDHYRESELANAAVCYLAAGQAALFGGEIDPAILQLWPWQDNDFKPSKDAVENYKKAGALIAAEIDRVQRMEGGE